MEKKQRVRIRHIQGGVCTAEISCLYEQSISLYGNLVKAMQDRAKSVWGVRFEEVNNGTIAHWPKSDKLPDGWKELVTIEFE